MGFACDACGGLCRVHASVGLGVRAWNPPSKTAVRHPLRSRITLGAHE
ncbi:hypothetical protein STVIR_3023 [Streptomyces viridochromogenes Tue57]|uniref:Uncharacterized protein n=1 Tax=Streptomyces viridochromogenes Tue57 TaxID=1160705 RepID=L8PEM3_STRVR|nr:hypothetical protein STVIR_3023 [Streptomyces viridochromogenes Tue57]